MGTYRAAVEDSKPSAVISAKLVMAMLQKANLRLDDPLSMRGYSSKLQPRFLVNKV